jgi:hypothetical protein
LKGAVVRTSDIVYFKNGRGVRGIEMTVDPETFEQYRQGYRCIECHHAPQPEAFPVECVEPYCRFRMRELQMRKIEAEYEEVELWPEREPTVDSKLWTPPGAGLWSTTNDGA